MHCDHVILYRKSSEEGSPSGDKVASRLNTLTCVIDMSFKSRELFLISGSIEKSERDNGNFLPKEPRKGGAMEKISVRIFEREWNCASRCVIAMSFLSLPFIFHLKAGCAV